MSTGETNLRHLIRTMSPLLDNAEWIFATINVEDESALAPYAIAARSRGVDVGVTSPAADGLGNVSVPMSRITLKCTRARGSGTDRSRCRCAGGGGVSANVIAAYYHDHIFVPKASADRALAVLTDYRRRPIELLTAPHRLALRPPVVPVLVGSRL